MFIERYKEDQKYARAVEEVTNHIDALVCWLRILNGNDAQHGGRVHEDRCSMCGRGGLAIGQAADRLSRYESGEY